MKTNPRIFDSHWLLCKTDHLEASFPASNLSCMVWTAEFINCPITKGLHETSLGSNRFPAPAKPRIFRKEPACTQARRPAMFCCESCYSKQYESMEAYHMRIAMQLGSAIPTRFICSHNQNLDNMFDVWQKYTCLYKPLCSNNSWEHFNPCSKNYNGLMRTVTF